jgi:hypothetical protein
MASATWKANPWLWVISFRPMHIGPTSGNPYPRERVLKPVRGFEHNSNVLPNVMKEPGTVWMHGESERVGCTNVCPYGRPGDRLWVRETWVPDPDNGKAALYRADIPPEREADAQWVAVQTGSNWKPSIHMPRWACRLVLEVTGVRVERLQEISEEDAVAEGVEDDVPPGFKPEPTNRDLFRSLWESIHG